LPGVLLGVVDQFLKRLGRHIRVDDEHIVHVGDAADRLEALHRIVRQLRIESRVHGERADMAHDKGMTIRGGPGNGSHPDGAAGAWARFDDDGIFESTLKPLPEKPRQNVRRSSGSERHDQKDVLTWIGLGCDAHRIAGGQADSRCSHEDLAAIEG
jgi:hypothetical protein